MIKVIQILNYKKVNLQVYGKGKASLYATDSQLLSLTSRAFFVKKGGTVVNTNFHTEEYFTLSLSPGRVLGLFQTHVASVIVNGKIIAKYDRKDKGQKKIKIKLDRNMEIKVSFTVF